MTCQSSATQGQANFHIRFIVVPIALVPTGIVGILIVVLLIVLVVPIAVATLLARRVMLTLGMIITVVVIAMALSLAGALALTLGDSRHVGWSSEADIVSNSTRLAARRKQCLVSIRTREEVTGRMQVEHLPDHQVMEIWTASRESRRAIRREKKR